MGYKDYWVSYNRKTRVIKSNKASLAKIVKASKEGTLLENKSLWKEIKLLQEEFKAEYCPCENYEPVRGYSLYKLPLGKVIYALTEKVRKAVWELAWRVEKKNNYNETKLSRFLFDHCRDLQRIFFSENFKNGYCQHHWTDILGQCWNYKPRRNKQK